MNTLQGVLLLSILSLFSLGVAHAAPAVFFNDNLSSGRTTFINTVAAAGANASPVTNPVVIEFDILNNSTNSSGVTAINTGSGTIYVRTTQAGLVARNNENGDLNNGGFTIWSNSYTGGFSNAEAMGYKLEFFSDAGLTTPYTLNALGLHVTNWGTCCATNNATPSGGTANASQVYLKFGATDPLLLGGISTTIPGTEHFIAAINDTNFFSSVTVIANGNGERFGAGSYLMLSTVPLNSVPAGSSVVAGTGLSGAGAASKLAFSVQPTNTAAGASVSPAVKVQIQDASGNLVTSATDNITLAIGTNPGSGTLAGTATVAAVGGEATFSNLSINKTGTGYTLAASSGSLTGATSSTFNITPGVASLATSTITAAPTSITANGVSTSTVTVQLKDANGNNLTSSGGAVTLSTSLGSLGAVTDNANGTYTATLTSGTSVGTATITGALGGSAITDTATVALVPGPAAQLAYSVQPSNTVAGVSISPAVKVQVQDAFGNVVTSSTANITLAIGTNPGSGTLSGTATVAAVSGEATFSNLSINKTGTGYTLAASSSGLTGATSTAFNITPAAATASTSTISASPLSITANGTTTATVTVQLKDAFENNLVASGGTVTLSTTRGSLGGVTNNNDGTYNAILTSSTVAGNANITGKLDGNDIVDSETVAFTPGPASTATSTITASLLSITANGTSTSIVTVQLKDVNGNNLTSSGGTVALSSTLGTLGVVTNNNDGTYTATLTSSTSAGNATITGTLGGASIVDIENVAFIPGAPARLAFSLQPSSTVAGTSINPAVKVQVQDVFGNVVPSSSASITLAIGANPGGGVLAGTATVAAVSSESTFSGLSINKTGLGYTLVASSSGLSSATSSAFNITPGAASVATSTITASPSSIVADGATTSAVTVQLKDINGNNLTSGGATITLSATLGTLSAVIDNNNGTYTATLTSAKSAGTATITGTLGGAAIADNETVAFTPGAASVATSTITASPSSIVADGTTTSAITVQLKDVNGNNLTSGGATITLSTTLGTLSAVTDNNNGTYTATLTSAKSAGTATITGTLGGAAIADNEAVAFTPGAASVATSTITASPTTVEAGQTSKITVQLKDANGNNLTVSGGAVVLSLVPGLTGATISEVIDNKDGTYTATVSTKTAGTLTISGTLAGTALTDTESVGVSGNPVLTLSKTPLGSTEAPLSAGMSSSYQIQVVNQGTASSSTATMLESIGRGLQVNSFAGSGWSCTYPNGQPLALPAKGPLIAKCALDTTSAGSNVSSASALSDPSAAGSQNSTVPTGITPLGGKAAPITVSVTPLPGFLGLKLTTESSIDPTGGSNPPQPGPSCAPASACANNDGQVAAQPIPTVELGFSSARIPVGGQTRLTITIVNKTASEFTGLGQSQALPSGLAFLSDPKPLTNCNGSVAVAGSSLNLTNGKLAAGGSCNFSALVTSNAPSGSKITVTAPVSAIKNAQDKTNDTAVTADLTIDGSFAVRKFFRSAQGALGIPVKMTVAIDNTGAAALTDASFTEDLPVAPGRLLIADDPQLENTCAGSVSAVPKSNRLALSGGRVPAGGCVVSVMVVADEVGDYLATIPEGGVAGSPNGLRGTLPDGSALGSAPGASARINVEKPASITGVFTKRVGFGQQIPQVGATVVLKDADGQIIATTTTKADGSYVFDNLPPTLLGDSSTKYRVEFVAQNDGKPALIKGSPESNDPSLNGVPDKNGITGVTLLPGEKTPDQNGFLVDPSGVIYDSITRQPVPGTRVTLIGPNGQPVPDSLLDKVVGTANGVPVGSDGLYVLLLTSEAPSGVYRLKVDVPAGYQPASDTTTSIYILAEKTIYEPALGGGVERIQPQETAPTVGQDTRYYMAVRFVIADRPETSSNGIIQNHMPIDPVTPVVQGALQATKIGNVRSAELGDSVGYTIRLKNDTNVVQYGVTLKDTLPVGFKYIGGTSSLESKDRRIRDDQTLGIADGQRVLNYQIGNILPGESLTLTYRARVGVGSTRGDGVNRAKASSLIGTVSNEAQYGIRVDAGVFSSDACVIGTVYRDCNDNGVQDESEQGVAGVRMYFSDGAYMVSDVDGRYSFCGRPATTQALKVDPMTLPKGSKLGSTSNRDAGDPESLFLDLKSGEMHRADFRIVGCPVQGGTP